MVSGVWEDPDLELPRKSRRERTRDKVCSAAREVFLAQGYSAATMEQIAVAAGVGRSTLYTHFADKNEILAEIAERHLVSVTAVIAQLPGPKPSRRQIDRWIQEFAEFSLRERSPTMLLISANFLIDAPPAAREFGAKVMRLYAGRLPVFAQALEHEGGLEWTRATAAVRELSWALVQYAAHGAGEREAHMLEVAGDLLEQLVKGWF
jgi:AcrR family transcriptional regulator